MSFQAEVILFVLGLAFGSFLNVATLRFKPKGGFYKKENFSGRSHCPYCLKVLSWYELVPILSFLIQKGKCRSCQRFLSWQYPIVELVCGLIFVFVPLAIRNLFAFVGPNYFWYWALSSFIWIVAFMFLLVAFIIDVYHYLIPNSVNLTLLIISVIWMAIGIYFGAFQNAYSGSFLKQFQAIFPSFQSVLANHILGGIAPALFFLLIFIFSGQKAIGMGDVKLIGSLGFLFGWPDIILITFLSFVIGAIVSIFLIILKKKKITDKIPFGPFIVISASIVFFFGAGLMNAYFAIIGI